MEFYTSVKKEKKEKKPEAESVYNVCGLACILGITSPYKQVSLSTSDKETWRLQNGAPPLG